MRKQLESGVCICSNATYRAFMDVIRSSGLSPFLPVPSGVTASLGLVSLAEAGRCYPPSTPLRLKTGAIIRALGAKDLFTLGARRGIAKISRISPRPLLRQLSSLVHRATVTQWEVLSLQGDQRGTTMVNSTSPTRRSSQGDNIRPDDEILDPCDGSITKEEFLLR